jgi:hypothetical protein
MAMEELRSLLSPMLRVLVATEAVEASAIVLAQRGVVKEVLRADDPDGAALAAVRLIDHHGSSVTAFAVSDPGALAPGQQLHDPHHLQRWLEIGVTVS